MDKYNGAVDNQSVEQKALNYKLAEVCSAPSPVIWIEKTSYTSYPIRDQDGSSQCVCMTEATEIGIIAKQKYNEWIDFSSSFLYQQRGDKTQGGCMSTDVYSVFPKIGNILESIMPSQAMNEATCMAVPMKNWYKDLAKPFSIARIELPIDFETVASTIQATGKGVMVWFRFSHSEWGNKPEVLPQPTTSGHSVTAVDFTLLGSKKYLVIQDSWGLSAAINGLRFISEEYFNARCFLASYLKEFKTISVIDNKPIFDGSVKSLQDILKYEGLMATNIDSTGFLGSITKAALIKFQVKYSINPALGNFGPITKQKLSELYK